jgi:hypothetical protein
MYTTDLYSTSYIFVAFLRCNRGTGFQHEPLRPDPEDTRSHLLCPNSQQLSRNISEDACSPTLEPPQNATRYLRHPIPQIRPR